MSAADERVALLRVAEEHEDPVAAVAAFLLGHACLDDPSSSAGWLCGCLHQGRLGESHGRHQGTALFVLMGRRGWLA